MKQYAPLEAFVIIFDKLLESQKFHCIKGTPVHPKVIGLIKDMMHDPIPATAVYAETLLSLVNRPESLPVYVTPDMSPQVRAFFQDLAKDILIVQPRPLQLDHTLAISFVSLVISNTPR